MKENESEELTNFPTSVSKEEEIVMDEPRPSVRQSIQTTLPEHGRIYSAEIQKFRPGTSFDLDADSFNPTPSCLSLRSVKDKGTIPLVHRNSRGLKSESESQAAFFPDLSELLEFFDMSLSSEDTEISYNSIEQSWAETDNQFFDDLGEVPNVSSIKLGPADYKPVKGKFTNPLTGSPVLSLSEFINTEDIKEEESKEEVVEEEEQEDEFYFENFDAKYPTDKVEKIEEEANVLENLWTKTMQSLLHPIHASFGLGEKLSIDKQISKFLDDIIKEVARICSLNNEVSILEEKMDKVELFRSLLNVELELYIEKKVCSFLNQKIVEFYRRKGKIRPITPNTTDDSVKDYFKYKQTISHLDEVLGIEKHIAIYLPEKIEELTENAIDEEDNVKNEILKFEKIIKQAMKCEAKPRLAEIVNRGLRDMATLRNKISQVRLVLLQNQHTLSELRLKINELNHLGGGLYLPEYERLENETSALDKKIEDRKNMLAKQHECFHGSLHTMAHLKFSTRILREKVRKQTLNLNFLIEEKNSYRNLVHSLNLAHERRRNEIHELTVKSGLLAKPALLKDYDKTMKNIAEQRKNVELLRQTKLDIEAKIKSSVQTLKSDRKQ